MSVYDQQRFLAHLPTPQPLFNADGTPALNNLGKQLRTKPLSTSARLTGLVIALKLNPDRGEWRIGRNELTDLTGLGLTAIKKAIGELEQLGIFTTERRGMGANKTYRLALTCPATCPNKEAHNNPEQPTFRGSPEARTFLTASEWQNLINNLPKDSQACQLARAVLPDMNPKQSLEIMNAYLMGKNPSNPAGYARAILNPQKGNSDRFIRERFLAKPAEAETLEPADLANDYSADLADEYDLPSFDEQARAYGFDDFGQNPF
jgi:hypothetical protein